MVRVMVLYRWRDGARFDHADYATRHLPMADGLLAPHGLRRLEFDRILSDTPASNDIVAATRAYFDTAEAARAALAAAGPALLADVPRYSDLQPELSIAAVAMLR